MRLTSHSDYALRLLIYCALRPTELVTIAEVAQAYDISRNHLMKIAHKLALAGFLQSARGRNGGLRLASPADKINIGKVVRVMEQDSLLVECFDRATNTCVIAPACELKHVLARALEDFYACLDRSTLADIARPPKPLLALLEEASA
jgi:Rrf2 family nitric oxide-sensitive transcriptional repressor